MRATILLLLLLVLTACTDGGRDPAQGHGETSAAPGDEARVTSPATPEADAAPGAGTGAGAGEATGDEVPTAPRAERRGRDLVLIDEDGTRPLATLDEVQGRVEHVALRPGDHEADTVLALTRVDDRYELRYLVVDGDDVSDLYWFPWRLQVDEATAAHSEVAPRPVWAPDGSAVAWLEWDGNGTRLRTVGWMDEDRANNPSDDTATYRVAEVPAGAQLQRWEHDGSTPVLVADDGEVEWRIELGAGRQAVAMPVEP